MLGAKWTWRQSCGNGGRLQMSTHGGHTWWWMRKPQMHKAIVQARRFAVDSTLEGWVDIQNVEKGINPAPGIVMQQAVAVKRRIGLDHPANHRSARRWLQRWRCRCGVQLRRGNVRERLSVDQMHRKVIHGAARKCSRGVGWFWVGGVGDCKKPWPFSGREIEAPPP